MLKLEIVFDYRDRWNIIFWKFLHEISLASIKDLKNKNTAAKHKI